MDQSLWTALNRMDRTELERILQDHGFHCDDRESNDELRQAIAANVEDGTIDQEVIEDA